MDKKFLHRVLDQIVDETRFDYDRKVVVTPLHFPHPSFILLSPTFIRPGPPLIFTKHCRGVYGLNDDEVKYVWKQYKRIINDKIGDNEFFIFR